MIDTLTQPVKQLNKSGTSKILESDFQQIDRTFALQKQNQFKLGHTTVVQRIAKLKRLKSAVLDHRPELKESMKLDFAKHPSEVDLSEIYAITSEIKHTCRHLHQWMSGKSVSTPLALLGSSSKIHYEPKGVVLIISPWNFPISLTLGPLVSAIAAGNAVMIKPSEHTPHTAVVIQKIIEEIFHESEVALFQGAESTSTHLLSLPFNHIYFTGSSAVGKIVMKAASKHLASVTLELGGKSPTIVDETADIKMAARRITWAKYMNNGQVCVAPDHIYVHERVKKEFIEAVKAQIIVFFSDDPKSEPSYARIVNQKHYQRIKGYVQQAITRGAQVEAGADFDDEQRYIAPTVLTQISMKSSLMENEIFGPVMPVLGYLNIDEVIQEINQRDKPLALYVYSSKKKNSKHIIANTRAGGTSINHSNVHFSNTNLPFGGSNQSGIGKGHGEFGFKAFSNDRGILKQHLPSALEMLMPPYNGFKQKLIDLTIKYC